MLGSKILPWLDEDDYAIVKSLSPGKTDLPESFSEWLEEAVDQLSVFEKSGIPVERVNIRSDGLSLFCTVNNIEPNEHGREAYALYKFQNG